MPMIPPEFIRELEDRSRLEEIAPSYVNLKRRGKNLVGLCPFHNEKSPSFNIYPGNNSYYCFGCGKGGGVVNFIMEIERLDFIEAVKWLAQRAGERPGRRPQQAAHAAFGGEPGGRAVLLPYTDLAGGKGRAGLFPGQGAGRGHHQAFWPGLCP